MNWLPKKRVPSTLLGLSLDGTRLDGVVVRRTNGSLQVLKQFSAVLALNPLNADPELVGREIRNHLDQAGIREKRCVVGLPLSWALTWPVPIPAIPEEDVEGFLAIEAERSFPYSPDGLIQAVSRARSAAGDQHAVLVAIPRSHLVQLEAALRAAQLRPMSFTLAITAVSPVSAEANAGSVVLFAGDNGVDLMVCAGGGVSALRALEGAHETEEPGSEILPDALARELRLTLGQLPPALRATVQSARFFGARELPRQVAQDLSARLQALGLPLEIVRTYPRGSFPSQPPPETAVSAAFSVAARQLTTGADGFEFLPPKVSAWQQVTGRFSSRRLAWVGGAAAVIILFATAGILAQQWKLSQLRSEWAFMEPHVRELEDMQQQIRRLRPWFDESFASLSILRRITEAFPVDGVVTAKTIEIRDLNTVTCSGTARDNASFLKMYDQLRAAKEIGDLKVDSLRGKAPLQFTINFQWGQGNANEN